jgi:hypothetical protein
MTLTIACVRETFAVLAADGLWKPTGKDFRKTLWCPNCPLACTASGSGTIAEIQGVLNSIHAIDDGTFNQFADQLTQTLQPNLPKGMHVACHVALVRNERAEIGWVRVGNGAERIPPPNGWQQRVIPDELRNVVDDLLSQTHGADVQSPDQLADLMLDIVKKAIAEDKAKYGGAHISGTANAVICMKDGARPYPPLP